MCVVHFPIHLLSLDLNSLIGDVMSESAGQAHEIVHPYFACDDCDLSDGVIPSIEKTLASSTVPKAMSLRWVNA